jgi:hypothetical protein
MKEGMSHAQIMRLHNKYAGMRRDPADGSLVFFGMGPKRVCLDPDAGFNSRYGDGKTGYICAICGRSFGQTTVLSYYLALGAWAHNSCIARHCCGRQDACTLPPHERKE